MRTRLLTLLASAVALLACAGPASAGVTEFATGLTPGGAPADITTGPDGNLWFTAEGLSGGLIGRLDPATGTVTEYSVPNARPSGIALGPDGNLWFTERDGNGAIGRITPGGLVTEYTAGLTPNQRPAGIAEGGDGALWFTTSAAPGRIGRFSHEGDQRAPGRSGARPDSVPSRPASTPRSGR